MLFLTLALAASPILMFFTGEVQYNAPAFGYTTCHYEAPPDLKVRVVVDGLSCPFSIKYDPATGTWTR